jgi:hypothetical protein
VEDRNLPVSKVKEDNPCRQEDNVEEIVQGKAQKSIHQQLEEEGFDDVHNRRRHYYRDRTHREIHSHLVRLDYENVRDA